MSHDHGPEIREALLPQSVRKQKALPAPWNVWAYFVMPLFGIAAPFVFSPLMQLSGLILQNRFSPHPKTSFGAKFALAVEGLISIALIAVGILFFLTNTLPLLPAIAMVLGGWTLDLLARTAAHYPHQKTPKKGRIAAFIDALKYAFIGMPEKAFRHRARVASEAGNAVELDPLSEQKDAQEASLESAEIAPPSSAFKDFGKFLLNVGLFFLAPITQYITFVAELGTSTKAHRKSGQFLWSRVMPLVVNSVMYGFLAYSAIAKKGIFETAFLGSGGAFAAVLPAPIVAFVFLTFVYVVGALVRYLGEQYKDGIKTHQAGHDYSAITQNAVFAIPTRFVAKKNPVASYVHTQSDRFARTVFTSLVLLSALLALSFGIYSVSSMIETGQALFFAGKLTYVLLGYAVAVISLFMARAIVIKPVETPEMKALKALSAVHKITAGPEDVLLSEAQKTAIAEQIVDSLVLEDRLRHLSPQYRGPGAQADRQEEVALHEEDPNVGEYVSPSAAQAQPNLNPDRRVYPPMELGGRMLHGYERTPSEEESINFVWGNVTETLRTGRPARAYAAEEQKDEQKSEAGVNVSSVEESLLTIVKYEGRDSAVAKLRERLFPARPVDAEVTLQGRLIEQLTALDPSERSLENGGRVAAIVQAYMEALPPHILGGEQRNIDAIVSTGDPDAIEGYVAQDLTKAVHLFATALTFVHMAGDEKEEAVAGALSAEELREIGDLHARKATYEARLNAIRFTSEELEQVEQHGEEITELARSRVQLEGRIANVQQTYTEAGRAYQATQAVLAALNEGRASADPEFADLSVLLATRDRAYTAAQAAIREANDFVEADEKQAEVLDTAARKATVAYEAAAAALQQALSAKEAGERVFQTGVVRDTQQRVERDISLSLAGYHHNLAHFSDEDMQALLARSQGPAEIVRLTAEKEGLEREITEINNRIRAHAAGQFARAQEKADHNARWSLFLQTCIDKINALSRVESPEVLAERASKAKIRDFSKAALQAIPLDPDKHATGAARHPNVMFFLSVASFLAAILLMGVLFTGQLVHVLSRIFPGISVVGSMPVVASAVFVLAMVAWFSGKEYVTDSEAGPYAEANLLLAILFSAGAGILLSALLIPKATTGIDLSLSIPAISTMAGIGLLCFYFMNYFRAHADAYAAMGPQERAKERRTTRYSVAKWAYILVEGLVVLGASVLLLAGYAVLTDVRSGLGFFGFNGLKDYVYDLVTRSLGGALTGPQATALTIGFATVTFVGALAVILFTMRDIANRIAAIEKAAEMEGLDLEEGPKAAESAWKIIGRTIVPAGLKLAVLIFPPALFTGVKFGYLNAQPAFVGITLGLIAVVYVFSGNAMGGSVHKDGWKTRASYSPNPFIEACQRLNDAFNFYLGVLPLKTKWQLAAREGLVLLVMGGFSGLAMFLVSGSYTARLETIFNITGFEAASIMFAMGIGVVFALRFTKLSLLDTPPVVADAHIDIVVTDIPTPESVLQQEIEAPLDLPALPAQVPALPERLAPPRFEPPVFSPSVYTAPLLPGLKEREPEEKKDEEVKKPPFETEWQAAECMRGRIVEKLKLLLDVTQLQLYQKLLNVKETELMQAYRIKEMLEFIKDLNRPMFTPNAKKLAAGELFALNMGRSEFVSEMAIFAVFALNAELAQKDFSMKDLSLADMDKVIDTLTLERFFNWASESVHAEKATFQYGIGAKHTKKAFENLYGHGVTPEGTVKTALAGLEVWHDQIVPMPGAFSLDHARVSAIPSEKLFTTGKRAKEDSPVFTAANLLPTGQFDAKQKFAAADPSQDLHAGEAGRLSSAIRGRLSQMAYEIPGLGVVGINLRGNLQIKRLDKALRVPNPQPENLQVDDILQSIQLSGAAAPLFESGTPLQEKISALLQLSSLDKAVSIAVTVARAPQPTISILLPAAPSFPKSAAAARVLMGQPVVAQAFADNEGVFAEETGEPLVPAQVVRQLFAGVAPVDSEEEKQQQETQFFDEELIEEIPARQSGDAKDEKAQNENEDKYGEEEEDLFPPIPEITLSFIKPAQDGLAANILFRFTTGWEAGDQYFLEQYAPQLAEHGFPCEKDPASAQLLLACEIPLIEDANTAESAGKTSFAVKEVFAGIYACLGRIAKEEEVQLRIYRLEKKGNYHPEEQYYLGVLEGCCKVVAGGEAVPVLDFGFSLNEKYQIVEIQPGNLADFEHKDTGSVLRHIYAERENSFGDTVEMKLLWDFETSRDSPKSLEEIIALVASERVKGKKIYFANKDEITPVPLPGLGITVGITPGSKETAEFIVMDIDREDEVFKRGDKLQYLVNDLRHQWCLSKRALDPDLYDADPHFDPDLDGRIGNLSTLTQLVREQKVREFSTIRVLREGKLEELHHVPALVDPNALEVEEEQEAEEIKEVAPVAQAVSPIPITLSFEKAEEKEGTPAKITFTFPVEPEERKAEVQQTFAAHGLACEENALGQLVVSQVIPPRVLHTSIDGTPPFRVLTWDTFNKKVKQEKERKRDQEQYWIVVDPDKTDRLPEVYCFSPDKEDPEKLVFSNIIPIQQLVCSCMTLDRGTPWEEVLGVLKKRGTAKEYVRQKYVNVGEAAGLVKEAKSIQPVETYALIRSVLSTGRHPVVLQPEGEQYTVEQEKALIPGYMQQAHESEDTDSQYYLAARLACIGITPEQESTQASKAVQKIFASARLPENLIMQSRFSVGEAGAEDKIYFSLPLADLAVAFKIKAQLESEYGLHVEHVHTGGEKGLRVFVQTRQAHVIPAAEKKQTAILYAPGTDLEKASPGERSLMAEHSFQKTSYYYFETPKKGGLPILYYVPQGNFMKDGNSLGKIRLDVGNMKGFLQRLKENPPVKMNAETVGRYGITSQVKGVHNHPYYTYDETFALIQATFAENEACSLKLDMNGSCIPQKEGIDPKRVGVPYYNNRVLRVGGFSGGQGLLSDQPKWRANQLASALQKARELGYRATGFAALRQNAVIQALYAQFVAAEKPNLQETIACFQVELKKVLKRTSNPQDIEKALGVSICLHTIDPIDPAKNQAGILRQDPTQPIGYPILHIAYKEGEEGKTSYSLMGMEKAGGRFSAMQVRTNTASVKAQLADIVALALLQDLCWRDPARHQANSPVLQPSPTVPDLMQACDNQEKMQEAFVTPFSSNPQKKNGVFGLGNRFGLGFLDTTTPPVSPRQAATTSVRSPSPVSQD